jgi:phosphate transport system substrate-binding protein
MKKIIYGFITLLAAIGATSCSTEIKRGEYAKGSATIYCDDGFKRILDEEIEVFEYQYPEGSIIPFYVSETSALDSLIDGRTQLAVATRELTSKEIDYIKGSQRRIVRQNCIAVDAVALIVNKDNPIGQLSMSEIGDILRGETSKWSQLAVADTTAIKIVFDNQGSSTVSYMKDKFLPEGKMISDNPNAFAQDNNQQVFEVVKNNKHALGIISVSWLGDNLNATKMPMKEKLENLQNANDTIRTDFTDAVKVLKVRRDDELQGFKPYQLYINSGEYPLFRKVYIISTGSNSTIIHSFYTFVTGFVGQKIISQTGIMPYHVNPRVVSLK